MKTMKAMKTINCLVIFAFGALRGAFGVGLRAIAVSDRMLLQQGPTNEQPMQKVADLEKGLLSIIESRKNGGAAAGSGSHSDGVAFAEPIKELIDDLKDKVEESHKASQNILNNLSSSFTGCEMTKSKGESEVETVQAEKGNKRAAHESCRNIESSKENEYKDCMTTLGELESAMTSACNLNSCKTHGMRCLDGLCMHQGGHVANRLNFNGSSQWQTNTSASLLVYNIV